jgi:hypothetical protein
VPARTDHKACKQPQSDSAAIWRYMDLPRLIRMLHGGALYLRRIDLFPDAWEGRWPLPNLEKMKKVMANRPTGIPQEQWEAYVSSTMKNVVKVPRAFTYANCWCLQAHESETLWRGWGPKNSVAVRSTYGRLVSVLPETAMVGLVTYVDMSAVELDDDNVLYPVMHKRREFAAEHEVRAFELLPEECLAGRKGDPFRSFKEPFPEGICRRVDLEGLISALVLSPDAEPLYESAVRAVVDRTCPSIPVERSSMLNPPAEI